MTNPPLNNHPPKSNHPPNGTKPNNNPPPSFNPPPNSEPRANLPYWQINVPSPLRTPTCPPFLFNLTPKDQHILSIPDEEYTIDSWATVKARVAENKLDEFKRVPSLLRRYLEFNYSLRQDAWYGSEGVQGFILRERLGWIRDGNGDGKGLIPKGSRPFECESDVKILRNDWPYGIDERIVHLVVWTKFALGEEEEEGGGGGGGGLKREVREVVDRWVRGRFTSAGGGREKAPGEDCVIWFKNWQSIKSIHAVEHFHVMLFDPDVEFVREVTGGDVPLWERMREVRGDGEVR